MSIATVERAALTHGESRRCAKPVRVRNKTRSTLVWVCVMLLAAEGAVRLRAWYRHGTGHPVADIYEPDGHLGRRLRPGATLRGRHRSLTINRWGFRGRDIPKEKPPGTIRIAAVGNSTTFGMEAGSDDAVWGARMIELLNEHANGCGFDFINGGVPGYTLAASITQLTENISAFDPDVVIVYQVGTDIAAHSRRQFSQPAPPDAFSSPDVTKFMQRKSLLLNLIRVNTAAFSAKQLVRRRHDRLDDRGIREYARRLTTMIGVGREHGWEMILCTCPRAFGDATAPTDQHTLAASALSHNSTLSLAGLNDAFARYNEAIRHVANEMDVTLVDLDRLVPKRRAYFADAMHLNDSGHWLVGEAIAGAVMDDQGPGAVAVEWSQHGVP